MVYVNLSAPKKSWWGRARKLKSIYDVMDFFFADYMFSGKRDLLQAYSASQKQYRQFGPLQGLESWL